MAIKVLGGIGVRRMSRRKEYDMLAVRGAGRHVGISRLAQPALEGGAAAVAGDFAEHQSRDRRRGSGVISRSRFPWDQGEWIRLEFDDQNGTKDQTLGYVTASHAVFLATSSLVPLGTSVILEAPEGTRITRGQNLRGRVVAVYPGADEFGFPPGIGVAVTRGLNTPPEE